MDTVSAPRTAREHELDERLTAFGLARTDLGSWIAAALATGSGEALTLTDPATGRPLLSFADGGAEAAAAACAAAAEAFPVWQAMGAQERGAILYRTAEAVRETAEPLACLEALSAGKPIRDTRREVAAVAGMFQYYAGWADKLMGETIPVPTSHLCYTRREALGPVVQITPWNAPLFTAGWQIAPALAAGNTVVLKPSELTPLTSLVLARLTTDCGAPPGAVNVLLGAGATAGDAAVRDPRTRLVVFVGSRATGARVAAAAAENVVPTILELGGKSANIVFADADLDRAALGAQAAVFSAAGQSCVAGTRLLVDRRVHGAMVERLTEAATRIPIGDPLIETTEIGPINNAAQHHKVSAMVREGEAAGARVAAGGGPPPALSAEGFYYAPTVLDDVAPEMAVAREEIFGPVLSVIPFSDEAEAIALANATPYGLAGAVWTADVARAHRVAARVRAGTFWINAYKTIGVMAPFGGFGQSGYGRSSGLDALHAYTAPKAVWVETAEDPPVAFGYQSAS